MAERPLTVLQMLPALQSGGVERGTLEVANALVQRGHRSLVMSAGGQLVARLTGQGSEHFTWPIDRKSLLTLRKVRPLRRFLKENSVDIVHARSRMPAWVAWRAWRGMRKEQRPRFLTTVHGLYSVNAYSAVMTKGERVIAVSDAARRYLQTSYPRMDKDRIVTIYRGIDPEIFPYGYLPPDSWLERWYNEHPYLIDRYVLTFPGRLTPRKGHEAFVKLVAALIERGHPVYGLIVGAEDPRHHGFADRLYKLIDECNVRDRITTTGHRMDIRNIYSVSNLVLSLSKKPESFGRTVLEALSLGVQVVGYDHGGVGDLLSSLFPSGRVKPGNLPALIDCCETLIKRPQTVSDKQPYVLQRMLDETLALYQIVSRQQADD